MDLSKEDFKAFYQKAYGILDIDSDKTMFCFICGAKIKEGESELICEKNHHVSYSDHLLDFSRMLKDYYDFTDVINYTSKEREEIPEGAVLIDNKVLTIDNKILRI